MRPRAMLRGAGALAGLGSPSGCNRPRPDAPDERHVIDIESYADRTRLFDVRVMDGADSELFRYSGEVTNVEIVSEVFRGVPETIQIHVSDGPEVRFD